MKISFSFPGFRFLCLVVVCLFLAGTSKSNWINSEKKNYALAGNSVTESAEKKDSLPEGVTEEWLKSLTDENGNRVFPERNTSGTGQVPEDPEGDAMQQKIFNGFEAFSDFGNSVSSAGDVNGDGYDDIIVGAYRYNTFTGRVYIYFGGLNMNTVADIILTGEATSTYFGYSVSSAGDVNSDGYSDVIVGAYGFSSQTGKSYIYFGGVLMNNVADIFFTGVAASDYFGFSVSSAGDVNDDGFSDVIIGAYGYNTYTGRAYIYFGGTVMNNIADVIMTGEVSVNRFGYSVSSAGDVNGDGYSDVVVGAYFFSSQTGKAYIYFGGASMNIVADVTMTGEATGNYFGYSVSTAGDVNGDGYSDVIVGAINYNASSGRVYIYMGGNNMNNTADVILNGEAAFDYFGLSVSNAEDVNGDGYSDVIVGAIGFSSNIGRAYIFFGGALMNNISDVILTGETTFSNFGVSVSSAGDVNGDGYSEVIVGAYGYDGDMGRVYLYDYYMKNEIISDINLIGETISNNFGTSVSSAGDVNGDGYSDVIVGAPFNDAIGFNAGRAYIYFGGDTLNNTADLTLNGAAQDDEFGFSVSSAGDINGDGYNDVIVGAPFNDAGGADAGRAYIYLGGSIMNNTADVSFNGEAAGDRLGYSVSTAGEVNGDGYGDVIIGAILNDAGGPNAGRVYIYFGGSIPNNIADLILTGAPGDEFGYSVSTAGNVNGDGYSDVTVGTPFNDAGGLDGGRAYIYYGGSVMNNVADVVMTGAAASNYFGRSVSTAGDVNRDGYSDLIVGADGYSSNAGRAYIYYGGSIMNNVADVIMTGEVTNNYFGVSVSTAGDVNGDGYGDIIVGANGYNTNIGRTYLYYGGPSMNNVEDVTMTGDYTGNYFGRSVSTAGDMNGDGYSDLIVGADG